MKQPLLRPNLRRRLPKVLLSCTVDCPVAEERLTYWGWLSLTTCRQSGSSLGCEVARCGISLHLIFRCARGSRQHQLIAY